MTDPTSPPPKPPRDPAATPGPTPTTAGTPAPHAAPRRIPRAQPPRPEQEDHRKVGQRVMEQRPHERKPTEHSATRGNRPDLRDLPPPRRDTPSHVWRADAATAGAAQMATRRGGIVPVNAAPAPARGRIAAARASTSATAAPPSFARI